MKPFHKPVLLKETIDFLAVKPGEKYIDATIGGGGHTEAILKLGGKILGIDCDPEAIEAAKRHLTSACPDASWQLVQGNFVHLKTIALKYNFKKVSGILFDLGVSSHQLEDMTRGFSFDSEAPLDMRMDPSLKVTAADLVNGLNRGELEKLFSKLGGENYSRRIAKAICEKRKEGLLKTCQELAAIIARVNPKRGRLHPATRCFQALRMAVNDELNNLKEALPQAASLLKPEGRLVILSFHSGEDRIAKEFLKEGEFEILTKKPLRPSAEEVETNLRSRSAKLRAGEKK